MVFTILMIKFGKLDFIDINDEAFMVNSDVSKSLSNYRNIVIFGIDNSSDSYSGRSDCIILVSINKKTSNVKLCSIYRDTYLKITGRSLDKVTHAYAYGGPELAISTLNQNLDLNITEFATVNFDSTEKIIDRVGGITLQIDSDEVKHITGINSAGKHHLNGSQALQYSRIRYEAGGDYKRTERMRTVLTAVFDKVKTLGIVELNNLVDNLLEYKNENGQSLVKTNISTLDVISLLPNIASFNVDTNIGWPYEVKGITLDRWYGVPVTLEENVSKLHEELFGQTGYIPSDTVKEISNSIINKTGYR